MSGGQVLIQLCVFAALLSWLLGLLESIGMFGLWPWAFSFGPVLMRVHRVSNVALSAVELGATGRTNRLKYRITEDGTCLFRRRTKWFAVQWNTFLDPKCVLEREGDTFVATARCSLGVCGFMVCWLAGWTFASLTTFAQGAATSMIMMLVGWTFIGLMTLSSWYIERRRFPGYVDELACALGNPQSTRVA